MKRLSGSLVTWQALVYRTSSGEHHCTFFKKNTDGKALETLRALKVTEIFRLTHRSRVQTVLAELAAKVREEVHSREIKIPSLELEC
ncbi:MAG TPA: hypothetical protein VJI33_00175 [Candidatus Paceibacterota bacterium]